MPDTTETQPTISYFKTLDSQGRPSYGTATDPDAVPAGATMFSGNADYSADMKAYVAAQINSTTASST